MDELEVNNNGDALNFDADDPFAIPPPLNDMILGDDPADMIGEEINPQDNVDGEQTQDSAEKKKKKRAFKPRVNLNEERLCSKKGIEALKNLCADEHFKGKGHEVSDLNKLLHRFEHWAQCLMPRWPFDNVVQKCEVLGAKTRVKNELKRIRRNEEEILRGEPEDDEEETARAGQVDATNDENVTEAANDENVTEAANEQDVAQEERAPVELTEEQRERIRRNRELAFEKRQAKRRRLEEESQTQSQLEDGLTNVETNEENSSSEQPSLTNVVSDNTAPDETLVDMEPEVIDGDTTRFENGSLGNINDAADLRNIPDNDSDNEAGFADILENDKNDEASLTNIPENDSNVVSHDNESEREDSSQISNMNNDHGREAEVNDDEISDDDEILNRSAFEINTPKPDASLSVDMNNELNTRKDEVIEDQEINTNMLENDRHETDSQNTDNTTAPINSSLLTTECVNLSKEPSSSEVTEGVSGEEMDIDNLTTE